MRARVMTTLMVTAGLIGGAISAPATAQSQKGGPGELWEAYPLDERRADPAPTPTAASPRPRPALVEGGEASGWSLGVLLVGALVAFAVGVLVPLLRRDRPAPSAAGPPPAPRVRNRRFAPGDRHASRVSSDSRRE